MKQLTALLIVVLACGQFLGCLTHKLLPAANASPSNEFSCRIRVFMKSFYPTRTEVFPVIVDTKLVAQVGHGRFVEFYLSPGVHTVMIRENILAFAVKENEMATFYFETHPFISDEIIKVANDFEIPK